MPELSTLSRASIAKLAADHERLSHMVRNLHARLAEFSSTPAAGVTFYPGKTTSEITALSSSTPGSGTADIYARNTSSNTQSVHRACSAHIPVSTKKQVGATLKDMGDEHQGPKCGASHAFQNSMSLRNC